jgi:hypothetical protein
MFQVLSIWAVFFVIWGLALILGMKTIEVPRRDHGKVSQFFRSISEFGPLHLLLVTYGLIALVALLAMWWMQKTTPLAFAFSAIVVFVMNCSILQRQTGRGRRSWLLLCGFFAVVCLVFIVIYRRFAIVETPFIMAEGLVALVGGWAIFWRPRPEQQLTAQDILDASINQASSPLYILRSIWPINRIFPNRTTGNPPGNAGAGTQ